MSNIISGQIIVSTKEPRQTFIIGEEVKIQTNENETLCGVLTTVFENALKLKRKSGNCETIGFGDIVDMWR